MQFNISHAPFGVRPAVTKPNPSFLQEIGEERFRQLVSDHYDLLKESSIKALFPTEDPNEFALAKKHAADFMIQISGGPKYFMESRGAPQMVGRHAPFKITPEARLVWLDLYSQALTRLLDEGVSETNVLSYWNYLDVFSIWMVNTPAQA